MHPDHDEQPPHPSLRWIQKTQPQQTRCLCCLALNLKPLNNCCAIPQPNSDENKPLTSQKVQVPKCNGGPQKPLWVQYWDLKPSYLVTWTLCEACLCVDYISTSTGGSPTVFLHKGFSHSESQFPGCRFPSLFFRHLEATYGWDKVSMDVVQALL